MVIHFLLYLGTYIETHYPGLPPLTLEGNPSKSADTDILNFYNTEKNMETCHHEGRSDGLI